MTARTPAEWQPIETAPQDGSLVDLWCVHPVLPPMRSADMGWRHGKWRQVWGGELNPGWHASHWMPLPSPPLASSDGGPNARLIATAPEIFAGLEELLDAIEPELIASASSHSDRDDADFREEFPKDYERCKRLRALLAKARGVR